MSLHLLTYKMLFLTHHEAPGRFLPELKYTVFLTQNLENVSEMHTERHPYRSAMTSTNLTPSPPAVVAQDESAAQAAVLIPDGKTESFQIARREQERFSI